MSTHVSSLPISSAPRDPQSIAASDRAMLCRVRQTGINLALWERVLPGPVAAFCKRLVAGRATMKLDVTAETGPALLASLAKFAPFSRAEHEPESNA